MKKPLNKFAIALWLSAAAVLLFNLVASYENYSRMQATLGHDSGQAVALYLVYKSVIDAVGSTVLTAMELLGIGALIELVDQIRWDRKHQ